MKHVFTLLILLIASEVFSASVWDDNNFSNTTGVTNNGFSGPSGGKMTASGRQNSISWTVNDIDIQCYANVEFSISILSSGHNNTSIDVEYSVNNGSSWTSAGSQSGKGNSVSSISQSVTGQELEIRVTASLNNKNSAVEFYDLSVTGDAAQASIGSTSSSSICHNSAMINATISNLSCASGITDHGVAYATSSNPTTSDFTKSLGSSAANVSTTLTSLNAATTYYARAYVTTSSGTIYGAQNSFTTINPAPGSSSTSNITKNSVDFSTSFSSSSCYTFSERGFVYGKVANPTFNDLKKVIASGSTTASVSGLSTNTKYYVRSYVTLSGGTTYYGTQNDFTTSTPTGSKTTLFSEDFDASSKNGKGYDGSTTDLSGVDWTLDNLSGSQFMVSGQAFNAQGTRNNPLSNTTWLSPKLSIACYRDIDVSLNLSESNTSNNGWRTGSIDAEYKLDNGSWTALTNGNQGTGFGSVSVSTNNLNGDSLQIRIRISGNNGQYNFDDISVEGNSLVTSLGDPQILGVTDSSFDISVAMVQCDVIAKGLVYSSSNSSPDLNNNSGMGSPNNNGNNSFLSTISGLDDDKTYYVRAYYTKTSGTTYSNVVTIKTYKTYYPIMFSEIGCDTSANVRYLEIYNKSAYDVDLNNYYFVAFENGATETRGTNYAHRPASNTNIKPGETYVIVYDDNTSSKSTLDNKADLLTTKNFMKFDGNDALVIYCANYNGGPTFNNGSITDFNLACPVDIIGTIGSSATWSNGNKSIKGKSLKRTKTSTRRRSDKSANETFSTWDLVGSQFNSNNVGEHDPERSYTGNDVIGNVSLKKLTINTSNSANEIGLTNRIKVYGQLNLTKGDLALGNHDMVSTSNSLSHGNSNSYVKINGSGKLKVKIDENSSNEVFPVGRNPYLPMVVNCVDCDGVEFDVAVQQGVFENPETQNTSISSDGVLETWTVVAGTSFANDITITLQWPAASEGSSFDRGNSYVAYWREGAADWTRNPSGGSVSATGSESGTYTQSITLSGMTGGDTYFFAVGDNQSTALPVNFSYFKAERITNYVLLEWETSSEENNSHFEVQRSVDGANWQHIGSVDGMGTTLATTSYSFTDNNLTAATLAPNTPIYYRLKQVDLDGTTDFSETRIVGGGHAKKNPLLFPVPARDWVKIEGVQPGVRLYIYSADGMLVKQAYASEEGRLRVSNLLAGSYLIRIEGYHKPLRMIISR